MRSPRDSTARRIEFRTLPGPEVTHGSLNVTPTARSVTVRVGGSSGGAVFQRTWPSAVLVSADGRTSRLRIVDVTRWAQIAIILAALLWIYEVWMWTKGRKEQL